MNLFKALPKLLGIKHKDFKECIGVPSPTYRRWLKEGISSMALLTDMLNRLHLSFADFIITDRYPLAVQSKEAYLIPDSIWTPIEWMPQKIATLYGENSSTGVLTKTALSNKLNMSDYKRLDRWMTGETPLSVNDFLHVINTLQIDARVFIADSNKVIARPVFDWEKNIASERVKELEDEVKKLSFELGVRNKEILKLDKELKSVYKKRESGEGSPETHVRLGVLAESRVAYPEFKRGYAFHNELWKSLPNIFGVTARSLCMELGLQKIIFTRDDVKIDTVIKVCNHLRISFMHLIRPLNEPPVVKDKGCYIISPSMFKPIENHLYNLHHVFKEKTFGLPNDKLRSFGVRWGGKRSLMKEYGKRSMMVTLANICTEFNIPPSIFIHDPNNRKRDAYSVSRNETLMNNCIRMAETITILRKENKELRDKIKRMKIE